MEKKSNPLIDDAAFAKVVYLPDGTDAILIGFHTIKVEGVSAEWLVRALRDSRIVGGDQSQMGSLVGRYSQNIGQQQL